MHLSPASNEGNWAMNRHTVAGLVPQEGVSSAVRELVLVVPTPVFGRPEIAMQQLQ